MIVNFTEPKRWDFNGNIELPSLCDGEKAELFSLAWQELGDWLLSEYGPDVAALNIKLERHWPSEGELENAASDHPSFYFDPPQFRLIAFCRRYFYR